MVTIDELRALAREIREERQIGGNTGERVGNTFDKVADLLESTGGDISDIREAVEQLLQDVGFIPRDVSRTATDAGFTNSEGELLFWLSAATDTLAGLITAANNNKLIALPTAEELAQALAAKQNRLTFDPRPIEGSTNPVTSDGINTAIANFVTRSVSDLIYYYTKSETYTKEEVNALVAAIKQFVPVVAQTLPTASADTMYKLYLIPSEDPQEGNIKDEYITIDNGASANPRYTWEKIGSVDIDISGKADIGTVPANVTRTASDATFVNNNHDPLFYLRQATSSLAGLMTSAEHTKLGALPTAQDLNTRIEGIIYDVSANNPTAGPNNDGKFTLAYILNPNNVNTLIPTAVRKGGMSIRFVQTYDNKYVQYRYMGTETTGTPNPFLDIANWQGIDSKLITGSKNLVESNEIAKSVNGSGVKCTFIELFKYVDYNTGEIKSSDIQNGIQNGIIRMKVSPGDNLIVYTNVTYGNAASIAFYNGDTYDKSVSYPYGNRNGVFIVPENVDNVIICGGGPDLSSYFAYVRSKDTQDLVDDLKNLIKASEEFTISRTTYNFIPFDKQGHINITTGEITQGLGGWYNEFKVNKNDVIYVKTLVNSGSVAAVAMYNGDIYNSQYSINEDVDKRITIPENITKVRVGFLNTDISKDDYGVRLIPATDIAGVEDMINDANAAVSVTIPTTYGWFNNAQVGETLAIASTGSAYSNAIYDIRNYLTLSKKISVYYKFGQDKKYEIPSYISENIPSIAILDYSKKVLYRTNTFVNGSEVDFSDYPNAYYLAICVRTFLAPIGFEISTKNLCLNLQNNIDELFSETASLNSLTNKEYSFSDFIKSLYVNLNGVISTGGESFGILEIKTTKNLYLSIDVYCRFASAYVIAFYKNGVFLPDISIQSSGGQIRRDIICQGTDVYDTIILTSTQEGTTTKVIKEFYALKKDVLIKEDVYYFANIPAYQDCVVGRDSIMYLANIGKYNKDTINEFMLSKSGNNPSGFAYTNDIIKFNPDSWSVAFDIYFNKYKNIETKIAIKKLTLRPVPKTISNSPIDKVILIIGDSLIASGDASSVVYDNLIEDGDINPILLGDQGSGNKTNMGHGSWSWDTWTNPDYENTPAHGNINPFFYNGELDFSHYMQQNYPNLSTIDYVIISLGTNDVGQAGIETFEEYLERSNSAAVKAKEFMSAILRDYPNCKIALGIPSPGAFSANLGYNFYPNGFRNAVLAYAYVFNNEFDNGKWNPNVTCVFHGWFIDPYEDYPYYDITLPSGVKTRQINNFIHPTVKGYQHWGVGYYNKIRAFIAGLL